MKTRNSSQYKNEYAKKTVQNIVDSGVVNNTNRTRELVDFLAKISADQKLVFSMADAKKLKETGFGIGNATVNGYFDGEGITLNINSSKALNAIVGHEVTHALEGTKFYNALKDTVIQFAKDSGDYKSRIAALREIYSGKKGYETDFESKLERELVADLIGDYLFTDADFINNLSTGNRNLFQKIYDEIKYLAKVVTAGSKEARELEKIKKRFEEAYRKTKNTAQPDGVKYDIGNERVIDLSRDNTLAERLSGIYGAKRYKEIQNYILETLSDQPIKLSDGKEAVVDRRDALHIANKSADKKTAEISHIKELVEKAELYAEDTNVEHNKFDYFCYYATDVKYENETFPIYLNVGLGKFDHRYHLYDITNRIRDTADRINGLERPRGIRSVSDASNDIIDTWGDNVNEKFSLSENAGGNVPAGNQIYGQDVAVEQDESGYTEGEKKLFAALDAIRNGTVPQSAAEKEGIKTQLRNSQEALNRMDPVADIQVSEDYLKMDKSGKQNWVVEKLRDTGYKVERRGLGIVNFAKKQLKAAFKYFDKGSAEETAFEALPHVLEYGIYIGYHQDHKSREYGTVTIAAPITINGKRGNMAVVVKQTTDNFYKVHRILTPDGSMFVLPEVTNEAESTATGESPHNGSLATPIDSASVNSIIDNQEIVKNADVAVEQDESGYTEGEKKLFAALDAIRNGTDPPICFRYGLIFPFV